MITLAFIIIALYALHFVIERYWFTKTFETITKTMWVLFLVLVVVTVVTSTVYALREWRVSECKAWIPTIKTELFEHNGKLEFVPSLTDIFIRATFCGDVK
jgi:hypothetical protein